MIAIATKTSIQTSSVHDELPNISTVSHALHHARNAQLEGASACRSIRAMLASILTFPFHVLARIIRFVFRTLRIPLRHSNSSHPTLTRLPAMWSSIRRSLRTFFSSDSYITGPPKLPPELEREIFEICARNNREACFKLTLVARRVREWYVLRHCKRLSLIDKSGLNRFCTRLSFSTT